MIQLKPFLKDDFPLLIKWIENKEDLVQFAGSIFRFPLTKTQLVKYLTNPNRNAFKVINRINGFTIGHSEIYLTNKNTAKLCRILIGEPNFRGKGLGQLIVNELVRVSFEKYKVKKVELNVFDWNKSAIKCYKKVGFKIVNDVTKKTEINNRVWTAINMTIGKNDWNEK